MRIIGVILILLVIIIGIAFTALNSQSVEFNYLVGVAVLPLAVILLASLVLGVVLSAFFMGFNLIRLKAKNRWLENKLKKTQVELSQL